MRSKISLSGTVKKTFLPDMKYGCVRPGYGYQSVFKDEEGLLTRSTGVVAEMAHGIEIAW
jgi:hypothetical protein